MNVLIPSYEPDERLIGLIKQLQASGSFSIVVVDDGSGAAYRDLFREARELGCTVITHATNKGKGCALKTGFRYFLEKETAEGIVCADSDGQHLPKDIIRIARSLGEHPQHIVLGGRRFTGAIPLRSRFGNAVTRFIFAMATGNRIYDTQTGLRGYSPDMLGWLLQVPGERFEYEMNLLLEAPAAGYSFHEVPIDTVYLDRNESSHFRPVADSARVYLPFLKFSASSVLSAVVDLLLVLLIHSFSASLLLSVWGARAASSVFNYAMNRQYVFGSGSQSRHERSMPKYFALVALVLSLNYGLMLMFHELGHLPLLLSKLLTEASLFLFSYWAQRRFVFIPREEA